VAQTLTLKSGVYICSEGFLHEQGVGTPVGPNPRQHTCTCYTCNCLVNGCTPYPNDGGYGSTLWVLDVPAAILNPTPCVGNMHIN